MRSSPCPAESRTFEELFEVWTWAHLKIHHKPIGILNIGGFFDPFHDFLQTVFTEGFLAAESNALLLEEARPGRASRTHHGRGREYAAGSAQRDRALIRPEG